MTTPWPGGRSQLQARLKSEDAGDSYRRQPRNTDHSLTINRGTGAQQSGEPQQRTENSTLHKMLPYLRKG